MCERALDGDMQQQSMLGRVTFLALSPDSSIRRRGVIWQLNMLAINQPCLAVVHTESFLKHTHLNFPLKRHC